MTERGQTNSSEPIIQDILQTSLTGNENGNGSSLPDANELSFLYFRSMSDIAYILDADRKVISFSTAAATYIYERFGKHIAAGDIAVNYVEEGFQTSFTEHFSRSMAGEKIATNIHVATDNGDKWYDVSYDPIIKDGTPAAVCMTIKDITGTERLKRMDQQMSNVSKVGAWEINFANGTNIFSPVIKQIYDIDDDAELSLEQGIRSYKEGPDRDLVQQCIDKAIATGEPFDVEVEFISSKGRQLWVRALGEAEHRNNKIYRLFGTLQDVTERRTVYEDLLVSQQYYRSLFEHNPDAVFALDLNEQIISANQGVAALAETGIQHITGTSFAKFCPPEDAEKMMHCFNEAQLGNAVNYDCGFITAKGNRKEINITNMPITINGQVVAIYGIAKDISEQIASRTLMQQSEANLKTVFDNTEIGYILLTDTFRIVSFNKPAQEYIAGRLHAQLKEGEKLETSNDDKPGRSLAQISTQVLAGKKVAYERFIPSFGSDGKWYNIIYHPVYGDGAHILGIIMEIENITDRKKSELELERSFDLLNEQNKRLLNFSYITSHNLRSHTSNIRSIITFLEEADNEEEKKEMMEYLRTVSTNLDETIHNLNDVVSINNSVNLIYSPLFLIEFISKATDLLKKQIIQKQAVIENKLAIDATVNYNPAFLESIMLNFLSNAIKYSRPDRRPVITLDSFIDNDQFVLIIADNGIGIDLEKNGDKLFGFYKTFNGNTDARGLGLFICKNQVEYMGGKIEVESELGKGTTFKIYFK